LLVRRKSKAIVVSNVVAAKWALSPMDKPAAGEGRCVGDEDPRYRLKERTALASKPITMAV
jgi:hypothetical protein